MDPFAVLAARYAQSTLPDLAHSALPGAPRQPFTQRRRWRVRPGERSRRLRGPTADDRR
jgi:hypothetical protein